MKKIFSTLVLALAAMTASATPEGYQLKVAATTETVKGTVTFTVDGNTATTAAEGKEVTVVVTPDEGYVVNEVSGQWSAAEAKGPQRAAAIELLKDIELTAGEENTWTFTMKRAHAVISVTYKKLMTNTDITIADIADIQFTGKPQTPTVTVKDGETELTEGTDYEVTGYKDNVFAGTATITIMGKGDNYAGETTKKFNITQSQTALFTAPQAIEGLVYNGEEQVLITEGTTVTGYMVYSVNSNSVFGSDVPTRTEAGGYYVYWRVVGNENMVGTNKMSLFVTIAPKPAEKVEMVFETATDGKLVIADGDRDLVLDQDYTMVILDADGNEVDLSKALVTAEAPGAVAEVAARRALKLESLNLPDGKYKAVFTFKGNYTGVKEVPFEIKSNIITGIDDLRIFDLRLDGDAAWYSLDGRRLSGKPGQKGVYIVNGRKVVVK